MAEELGQEESKKEEPKVKDLPANGHRKLPLIIPMLIVAALGVWFWMSRNSAPATQANAEVRIKSTLHLDTFVLNLSDTDQRAYLRVGIDLGLSPEPQGGEEAAPVAQIRDIILGVLAEANADDLMTGAGKAKLKEKLLHALQERAPKVGVEEVYFTEFLIQR